MQLSDLNHDDGYVLLLHDGDGDGDGDHRAATMHRLNSPISLKSQLESLRYNEFVQARIDAELNEKP